MAGMFLIGLLLAAWLGWAVLAGLAFVAGCVLAARYATTTALFTVVRQKEAVAAPTTHPTRSRCR